MNWKRAAIVLAKAVAGVALMMLAFEHPRVTMTVIVFTFLALFVANFLLNSVHYVVWTNFKPRLVSYQRLDRAPKHTIPKQSLLGQAITLLLQLLGYGLVLMFALGGLAMAVISLLGK